MVLGEEVTESCRACNIIICILPVLLRVRIRLSRANPKNCGGASDDPQIADDVHAALLMLPQATASGFVFCDGFRTPVVRRAARVVSLESGQRDRHKSTWYLENAKLPAVGQEGQGEWIGKHEAGRSLEPGTVARFDAIDHFDDADDAAEPPSLVSRSPTWAPTLSRTQSRPSYHRSREKPLPACMRSGPRYFVPQVRFSISLPRCAIACAHDCRMLMVGNVSVMSWPFFARLLQRDFFSRPRVGIDARRLDAACPSVCCTSEMGAPLSSACEAWAWRNQCGDTIALTLVGSGARAAIFMMTFTTARADMASGGRSVTVRSVEAHGQECDRPLAASAELVCATI
jgi:hypothetical protein